MRNGIQSITSDILEYLQKPKRKGIDKSFQTLSSYFIIFFIGIILFVSIILIYLIMINISYYNSFISTNISISNNYQSIKTDISIIDNQIEMLTKEFTQLDSQTNTLLLKKTAQEEEENNFQKQIKSSTIRYFQVKTMLESAEDQLFIAEVNEKRTINELDTLYMKNHTLYSKMIELEEVLKARKNTFKDKSSLYNGISSILSKTDFNLLHQWIDQHNNNKIHYISQLSDMIINVTPEIFHLKCDDSSNSLVVIKLIDGQIIGGFTLNNWNSYYNPIYMKIDSNAFLFNLNHKKKYDVIKANESIITRRNALPQFGVNDLVIENNMCKSNFPSSYGHNAQQNELTNGKEEIEIIEIEVFKLLFSSRDN